MAITRRIEVWSTPDDPQGFRHLDTPDVIGFNTTESADAIAGGAMQVSADYPYAHLLVDTDPVTPGNSKASVIRVYREDDTEGLPDVEFFVEEATETVGEPGTLDIDLRDIKIGLDDGIIADDMVWGGVSPLPPLGIGDLASIKAEYELYLERERYELAITATGGTFTLSANGNTTDTISPSASASTIEERLKDLATISSARVIKTAHKTFQIVFLNPTQLTTGLTVNTGNLTGGSASVTQENAGFDSSGDPTFTITVDAGGSTEATEAIPWNASARRIEGTTVGTPQGLQGLDNVNDVTVTGTGTYGDPWVITFYTPPIAAITNVTFAAGDAVLTAIQAGVLDPNPITISKPADQQAGDPKDHGNYGLPGVSVDTETIAPGSNYSIKVHALTQFAGCQLVFDTEPGQEYNGARIRVNSEGGGRHAIVIRTVFGDLVRRQEFTLAADTWTWMSVPDFISPPGAPQLIWRVACVEADPDDVTPFYVDWEGAELWTGEAASTAGAYALEVLERIQSRGALTWIEPAFTSEEDSNGDPWDEEALPFRADRGQSFGTHFLTDLSRMGYQYDLRPKPRPEEGFAPGDPTHELHLFNPFSRTSGIAVTQGIVAGALRPGSKFARRRVPRTHLLVETADGETTWVSDAKLSGIPRREGFIRADYSTEQGAELVGSAVLADDISNLFAVQVQLAEGVEPYRDFDIGDSIPVVSGRVLTHDRTVHSISLSMDSGGAWTTEVTASRLYRDALTRTFEAVRRLYDDFNRRRGGQTGGSAVTALPAPSPDASSGAHIHLLADEQEVDAEPIEFAALLASPLATTIPAFPTSEVTITQPGYWPFYVHVEFTDWFQGGDIWITRTRAGDTSQVWPPPGASDLWSSPGGSRFTDIAPAIDCEPGDVYQLWVDCGEEVTVKRAVFVPWLADRRPKGGTPTTPTELLVFTESGSHDFGAGVLLEHVWIIAGGGAGGRSDQAGIATGGGGAGGVVHLTNQFVGGVQAFTVGDGGQPPGSGGPGGKGGDSVFLGQTAEGGGGGGYVGNGGDGGCGGGGGTQGSNPGGTGSQGGNGGASLSSGLDRYGGGGGGYSENGQDGGPSGGKGGDGIDLSAWVGTDYGDDGWFAGGGGGARQTTPHGSGGKGGGGDADGAAWSGQPDGMPNTGGGGGGDRVAGPGAGGSGIIICVVGG